MHKCRRRLFQFPPGRRFCPLYIWTCGNSVGKGKGRESNWVSFNAQVFSFSFLGTLQIFGRMGTVPSVQFRFC
uniref:Uncharacterized protein n=1 Tax=Rhizophagus irregularis (strain DAOM 181602 / DAOM 197198 / MUCL 43194) TaxID=747089 RepID=U9SVX0_RHIID